MINFVDVEYSRRVNPIQAKYINNLAAASETAENASDEMGIDYLKKLGLTTLQVNVVTLLVEGADVETIAKELNYSESMIRQVDVYKRQARRIVAVARPERPPPT